MSEKYPNPCCRCGFCCLIEQCPASIILHNEVDGICPSLFFDGNEATCRIAGEFVPVGDGCCISARCYKSGIKFDFSSLPNEIKIDVAQKLKEKKEHNNG